MVQLKETETEQKELLRMSPEPQEVPSHPHFSSGPCAKIPGWSLESLKNASLGRSHRSDDSLKKLFQLVQLTREILEIPRDYHIGIIPGSATGAIESAIWNLVGAQPLTLFSHDVFSHRWERDITEHLKLKNVDVRHAPPGELPNCKSIPLENDVLLNWNGSTSGARFKNTDFLGENRQKKHQGLVLADITSAVFTTPIPWEKFDAIAFSWQKGLGGEAAHGMLVLSPKAVERLNTYQPPWPLPYLFKLRKRGQFYEPIFHEKTLNTPSLLCVEDFLQSLKWAQKIGGLSALITRSQENFEAVAHWVSKTSWVDFLTSNPAIRSTSTLVLKIVDSKIALLDETAHRDFIHQMTQLLADRDIVYDITNHGGAPPSLRLWGGPTIDTQDMKKLLPWLDWAYEETLNQL